MGWFNRLFRRDRLELDLDAELRFHIDQQARELAAQGMAPTEARRLALASFGGLDPIKESARDSRGTRWVHDFAGDFRYAFRTLRRSPAFTTAAVLSLAIGIGANTAVFGVVNALLIRSVPIAKPSEIFFFNHSGFSEPDTRFSYPAYENYQRALANVPLAAMTPSARMQVIAGDDAAELILGQLITGNWFDVMGIQAAAGRVFTSSDNLTMGAHPVIVLSYGYWQRRFAASSSVIGSTIRLNGLPMKVVGVAARGFSGVIVGEQTDLWAPAMMQQELRYTNNANIGDADGRKPWIPQDGVSWLTLVARVRPPATAAAVTSQVDALYRRDLEVRVKTMSDPASRELTLRGHVELQPGGRGLSDVRDEFGKAILVLMATVALVLLVACANLANLLMARSAARGREFAVRLSLGAGRGRLMRQLLTESLALALFAGGASLVLAQVGGQALLALAQSGPTPIAMDVSVDWTLVGFASLMSIVTGMLFGFLPALRLSATSMHESMKSGGRVAGGSERPGKVPLGRVLVVAQVALSLLLLVGATLFVRTLHNLLSAHTGFDRDHVVVARFDPRMAGYTGDTLPGLRARLLDGASGLPGVRSVSVAMCGAVSNCHRISDIDVPGRPHGAGDDSDVQEDYIDPAYFSTLGMTMVAGRTFDAHDDEPSLPVAIVNETMARHFFGAQNPLGRKFGYDEKTQFEIVGVVGDAKIDGLREAIPRMVFYPFAQHADEPVRNVYLRVTGDVEPARSGVRGIIANVDRNLAIREVVTLAALAERTVARERLVSELTGVFGLLAVAVACLGLYGTVSYSVARRTNEIGIRIALGAPLSSVRWLVLRETIAIVALGVIAGLAISVPLAGLIGSLLYGLSPHDPLTFAAATATLLAVGALAGAIPAWRASRVDPACALRAN